MTISSITGHRFTLPLAKPFSYFTASLESLPYLLIEIRTHEGMTGYGEAALAWDITGETQDGARASLHIIQQMIEKRRVDSLHGAEKLMDDINLALYGNTGLKCGIESALLDCMGKERDMPIHALLKGSKVPWIMLQKTFSFDEIQSGSSDALDAAYRAGVRIFKFKIGRDENAEKTAIRTAREKYPESAITLDANQAWQDPQEARAFLASIADIRIAWIEQPVRAHDYDGLAYIRSQCDINVMADESCHTLTDLKALHRCGAIDYANLKLAKCGGIFELKKMIAYCENNGIRYALGDMIHSSFGTAYNLHAATLGNFVTYDLTLPDRILNDCGGGLIFQEWKAWIPQKAGLGVELKNNSQYDFSQRN